MLEPSTADPALFRRGTPWRVVVDLNEACNINCSYCHIDALWGPTFKTGRKLPLAAYGALVRELDQLRVLDLTLTGGEVTVMPEFLDYLEVVDQLKFTSVQVITNGILLSSSMARELKSSGIARVSISIDGLQQDHDRARGESTWRRAWQGLHNALEAGLTVNVISVLGLHNIDRWFHLPPLLKELGVRSQNLSLMCRLGRAESAEDWQGVPESRLPEVFRVVAELEAELGDQRFMIHLNDGVLRQPGWSGAPTPLHAFQDQNPGIEAVVKVDGNVMRNRIYGKERNVGNICDEQLQSIWHADRHNRKTLSSTLAMPKPSALPELYYHYAAPFSTPLSRLDNRLPSRSASMRVRNEPWGKVIFDRTTFSIMGIYLREPFTV